MGESLQSSNSSTVPELATVANRKKLYGKSLIASAPKVLSPSTASRQIASPNLARNGGAIRHLAIFLVKIVALETVRKVSSSKYPCVWNGLQALQVICYPPFKWIQRWAPLRALVKGIQMFSRPLLVLSVATAFLDKSYCDNGAVDENIESRDHVESHPETLSEHPSHDTGSDDEALQIEASENWLLRLHKELENRGISLPERINEDELRRFYTAANEDFLSLLMAIKKTVHWRKTYRILSQEELETWSSMVFWHGNDTQNHRCLIVRLGVAFALLPAHQRPRFAQAVVSQVEHGILHLGDTENSKIAVIVDCHGISPLKIPMQVIRSCSSLLQENFPDRLAYLLVIRLPPVVRVVAQTLIQVLKPITRRKLKIIGKMYHKVLVDYLQTIPSCLGGDCTCKICSDMLVDATRAPECRNGNTVFSNDSVTYSDDLRLQYHPTDMQMDMNWDYTLRSTVIGILMVVVFVALMTGVYDEESSSFFSPKGI